MDYNKESNLDFTSDHATMDSRPPGDDRPECRDWKRNVCTKGSNCKYYHPPKSISDIFQRFTACHDYQNAKGCGRSNCKYLHVTKDEEEYIKENGTAPPSLSPEELAKIEGQPPLCNDYMAGKCNRGTRCKFRHVGEPGPRRGGGGGGAARYDPYSRPDDEYRDRVEMRRRYREDMMEDEIMYLRAQVGRLKRQVADLTATNESLMDENARLRIHHRPRAVSPVNALKLESHQYNPVGSGLTAAFSNSPRLVAADPYTVAPSRSALGDPYGGTTRSTPSALSFSATLPHYG